MSLGLERPKPQNEKWVTNISKTFDPFAIRDQRIVVKSSLGLLLRLSTVRLTIDRFI